VIFIDVNPSEVRFEYPWSALLLRVTRFATT